MLGVRGKGDSGVTVLACGAYAKTIGMFPRLTFHMDSGACHKTHFVFFALSFALYSTYIAVCVLPHE